MADNFQPADTDTGPPSRRVLLDVLGALAILAGIALEVSGWRSGLPLMGAGGVILGIRIPIAGR